MDQKEQWTFLKLGYLDMKLFQKIEDMIMAR